MEQYQELLVNVCITLIPVLATFIATWLSKKTQQIKEQIKNDTAYKYIDLLERTVQDSVAMFSETVVKKLKESGDFDNATGIAIFDECRENVLNILGETGVTVLNEVYADLDLVIKNLIEKNVAKQK